jgi:CheY-like chemotaxis protein
LRQPLHAMTLLAHALRRRTRDMPEVVEMLGHMDDALRTLRRMFEALLDVSKLDAGVMKTEPRVTALKPLLRSACQSYSLEADTRRLRLSLVPIEAYVETDPAILEMTISNLIANALKFTAKGGVLVGCRRKDGKIRIEVYDTGAGIPADRLEAIFEEFEHSRSSAHGANEGMGLGLALVRRYCDIMGYELDVRSIPGRGSRFAIILPEVAAGASDLSTASARKSTRQSLDGIRILVLDDERTVTFALSRDLKDRGADVISAERTEEAETLLANGDWPDAAIVDYDLGGEEMGDAFVARLESEKNRRLPTLILTGSTDPETLRLLAASGRRWLTKPADPGVLSAAVAGLVRD